MLAAGLGVRPIMGGRHGVVRQGYQTNMWGMPTYYLLHSGILKKHGIDAKEFAVPSGNLTMQQMVARQVDMGTFAGPSFIIGHDRGGLIAVAKIEYVGKTARVMARKDLGLKKVEPTCKGKKIASQTGSSIGNILVDQILPKAGLNKGDYTEVRMNVNDMVAAMAAKTVDAMANVEPYNAIAEAEGLANTAGRLLQLRQAAGVHGGDAGLRRQERRRHRALSEGLARSRQGLQERAAESRRHDLLVLHLEGLQDVEEAPSPTRSAGSRSARAGRPISTAT